jgi:ribonuclease HI
VPSLTLPRRAVLPTSAIPGHDAPVVAHVDGCVGPSNPGTYAGVGVAVEPHPASPALARGIEAGHPCTGRPLWSNNVAEYEAVLVALRLLYRMGWRGAVLIRSDSQLAVKQYNQEDGCYEPTLVELLEKLRRSADLFDDLALEWVSRERNGVADALARRGLESALRRSGRAS